MRSNVKVQDAYESSERRSNCRLIAKERISHSSSSSFQIWNEKSLCFDVVSEFLDDVDTAMWCSRRMSSLFVIPQQRALCFSWMSASLKNLWVVLPYLHHLLILNTMTSHSCGRDTLWARGYSCGDSRSYEGKLQHRLQIADKTEITTVFFSHRKGKHSLWCHPQIRVFFSDVIQRLRRRWNQDDHHRANALTSTRETERHAVQCIFLCSRYWNGTETCEF